MSEHPDTPRRKTPKYQVVAERLLADREKNPGILKLTQRELAARYGAHLLTLRHALEWLEREGRFERLFGRVQVADAPEAKLIGYPIWADSIATLGFHRNESSLNLLQDVHAELSRKGYTLDPQCIGPEANPNREKIAELCRRWSVVILSPWSRGSGITEDNPFYPILDRTVLIGAIQGRQNNCVGHDLYSSGRMATEELERLGAKRILFTGRSREPVAHRLLRLISIEDAISQCRNMELIYAEGGIHADEAFSAVKRFFIEGGECDAILANYSYAALGALRALADLKISVPEQVQVIGIGASERFTYMIPRPTHIAPDPQHFAREVARMAVSLAKGDGLQPNILSPVRLIQGETTLRPATPIRHPVVFAQPAFVES